MGRRAKGAKDDDVIDVEVVDDSADGKHASKRRAARLGVGTVARPCLVGAAVLALVGAVLPH